MNGFQYPISLNLRDERCLVIGGGEVASRKAAELTQCGGLVTVVSPRCCPQMERLGEGDEVRIVRREFRDEDVHDAFLVVVATNDDAVNRRAADLARKEKALVNVVDQPELCGFIAPAVLRRGPLTVAISTGGASPALAGRLKRELAEELGEEWGVVLERLAAWRLELQEKHPDEPKLRRDLMMTVARWDSISIVREHGLGAFEQRLAELHETAMKKERDTYG